MPSSDGPPDGGAGARIIGKVDGGQVGPTGVPLDDFVDV